MTYYLYLDQRDLINLLHSDQSSLRDRLSEVVRTGQVQVLLSFMHVIETWKHYNPSHRREVATCADSFSPMWVLTRDFLFEEEARAAIWDYLGVTVTTAWDLPNGAELSPSGLLTAPDGQQLYRFCPFREAAIQTFSPTRFLRPNEIPKHPRTFTETLDAVESAPESASMLTQIHDAYPDVQRNARATKKALSGQLWFVKHVFDRAMDGLNDSNRQFLHHLTDSFDLRRCPALYCYLQIREHIHRNASATSHPSEMVDVVHLVALPYVDAFSTDKRIVDYIRRAKLAENISPITRVRTMKPFRLLPSAIEWLETVVEGKS